MLPPQPPWPSRRLLQSGSDVDVAASPNRVPGIPADDPPSGINSDVVVILSALLCALICIVGLTAAARCVRAQRNRAAADGDSRLASPTSSALEAGLFGGRHHDTAPAEVSVTTTTTTKGLKKKALKALPKLVYADAVAAAAAARGAEPSRDTEGKEGIAKEVLGECAICLSEFGEREEVRVMPQCGHGFHVACVDTWLRSNSSCPSCRRPVVIEDPGPSKRYRRGETTVLEAVVTSSSSSSATSGGGGGGRGRNRSHGEAFFP